MRLFLFQGHPQPDINAIYALDLGSRRPVYRYMHSMVATDVYPSDLVWVVDHQPR
ncbi:hypothetical protein [Rubripirellula reticaptiva]|nr:hypothetical protein [Rubripirellula reticaptiva]